MISRVPFANCRSGVIGLAIAGNPENDGHLSPWQEAVGHEIIPDTHKNGCVFAVRHPGPLGIINRPWPQQIADWRRIGEAVSLSMVG